MKIKLLETNNIKFIFIYIIYIFCISNLLIYNKFLGWFTTKSTLDISGLIAYLSIGLFLTIAVVILLFSHKYLTKAFAIFMLFASAFAAYAIDKFGVAIDRSMLLNIINTNTTESLTLFSLNLIPYVLFLAVIPTFFVLKTKIIYTKPLKHLLNISIIFVVLLLISVAILYLKFNALHLAGNKSQKYMVYQLVPLNIVNALGSAAKDYIEDNYISKMPPKVVKAKVEKKEDLVVVLAIGESSRQSNFSLYGYKRRQTNPLLSKQKDLHILNGIAKYGSTIWALPQILSKDDVKLPSVTQKACIDSSCLVNFTLYDNCGTVKEKVATNFGHNGNCYDED
ncbi:MAG TPA: phosphoethanolamine transferase, partial [Epsilonproteobacteria bacterium]|nr:phosphoethanolamine transferase [Campylobacterota bacterium]